ncbi:hypothetical protein ELUMI_v1c06310 [Williamsoniiplasma luminosum]|uniref:Uncharacterized protein n=1 Tax=Williamsoniiplasma luminosum TaxID=214888 RepID=A0A2K8NXI5_9MOLU|nr:hypothetical protein [Williamsoniiplasma luminosum]ATZ17353.1 hypothetical protein ELUMI_v1c06310 [Williamsoniiplasma luminosum]
MSINKKELELNFFEPALGLIIANLEFLEEELRQEQVDTSRLNILIDNFNDLEKLEDFECTAETLVNLAKDFEKTIASKANLDQFKVMSYLYLATNLAKILENDGQLNEIISNIDNDENETEEQIIEFSKAQVIELIKEKYLSIKNEINQGLKVDDAFNKVLNILIKEEDFNEFNEGNSILIELLMNQFKIKESNIAQIFNWLIFNESIILLINFWEQSLSEMDEEN